jgi:2-haloacid dehalogenase
MKRRLFLELLGTAAAACGPPAAAPSTSSTSAAPGRIEAVAFDLFTIFDPRGVDRRVAAVIGENAGFAAAWKSRLFDYAFIRAASGQYADFEQLVRDSLTQTARAHHVELAPSKRRELEAAFTELDPWPDAATALGALRTRGVRLAPLANFAPGMIQALLTHGGVLDLFETSISTDRARTYKPDPRAYALAESTFRLPRERIAFAAFGGWDAAGATWFGFPTFWVNRLGAAPDELVVPTASGATLDELAAWVARAS